RARRCIDHRRSGCRTPRPVGCRKPRSSAGGLRARHLCNDPGMGQDCSPVPIMRRAGMQLLPGEVRPREGRAGLIDRQGTHGILRQSALPADASSLARVTEDVTWLHVFLTRLAGLGFPSPRPLPSFDGESWTVTDGTLWEAVSFLPGQAVGWAAEPSME